MINDIYITLDNFKIAVEHESSNKSAMEKRLLSYFFELGSFQQPDPHHAMHLVRSALQNKSSLLLHMPIAHPEIDFLCVQGNHIKYTLLNSAKPKLDTNAALCRAFCHYINLNNHKALSDVRPFIYSQTYSYADNLADVSLANMIMMPVARFTTMFHQFEQQQQPEDTALTILAKLINYFEAPYPAVLTRCYALKLLDSGDTLNSLLQVTPSRIEEEFHRLWLDSSLLKPTMRDDYSRLIQHVKSSGEQYLQEEYLHDYTLKTVLHNMSTIYSSIREA